MSCYNVSDPIIAPSPGRRCNVTKIAMALQRADGARLYKLQPASAVRSRRPDLIELGGLPALAMQRDKVAVATAQRKCRDRRRRR